MRAAGDLPHEQAHEIGIVAPGAKHDLHHELELLARVVARLLGEGDGREEPPPLLAEDRFEHRLLRAEVVVDEPVGDARLPGDVPDAGRLVALRRKHPHRGPEDEDPLVLGHGHRPKTYSGATRSAPAPLMSGELPAERACMEQKPWLATGVA